MTEWLTTGSDGVTRCWWPGADSDYIAYHDHEWGRPVTDDTALFEKICLEGFQAGLSWLTILRKRDNFRAAFAGFDIATVAGFGEADVQRLLGDAGIVRHEGKIRSAINNAARAGELISEAGSLAGWFWSFEPSAHEAERSAAAPVPAHTPTSAAIARQLRKRGWSFVGPTTIYAFMQAMGLVEDHIDGCHAKAACAEARRRLTRPSSRHGRPAPGGHPAVSLRNISA